MKRFIPIVMVIVLMMLAACGGKRFSGNVSEEDLKSWIEGLKWKRNLWTSE